MLESSATTLTTHRHYTRAPITEALIDIQASVPPDVMTDVLQLLREDLRADYPKMAPALEFRGQLSAGEQVGATAQQQVVGFVFYSKDQKQVAQVRRNGFTFSRLAPYEQWESLRDEARRLWDLYRLKTIPTAISRVALRYINQINIPLPMRDFRDYLRTFPEISTDLPQALSGFLMQTHIPQPDISAQLVLTQAMVKPPDEFTSSVVLDIDVFVQADLYDDEDIWGRLELLRDRKNDVFEACITNQTRRMII